MKQYKLYTTVGIIETHSYNARAKYVLHREDGPATIWYNYDGSIYYEGWYINNVQHREDGPAFIQYNKEKNIYREEWWWCGLQHRHDYTLPSVILICGRRYYYWYGVECKPEQLLDKDFRDRIQLERLG